MDVNVCLDCLDIDNEELSDVFDDILAHCIIRNVTSIFVCLCHASEKYKSLLFELERQNHINLQEQAQEEHYRIAPRYIKKSKNDEFIVCHCRYI